MPETPSFFAAWRATLAVPRLRALAIAAPVVVTVVLLVLRRFLDFVEARPGPRLIDPLLQIVPPRDVASLVFSTLWIALLFGLAVLARTPERFIAGLWAYAAVLAVRIVVMYLLPLDPPDGLVPLRDPFVEAFGEQRTLTRDLFFSGHTATLSLIAFAVPPGKTRWALFAAMLVVGIGVLLHHAHYTVDVVAAPFFSYASYRAAWWLVKWARPRSEKTPAALSE